MWETWEDMAFSKVRKEDSKRRRFQDEWTAFSKPLSLTRSETMALIKSGNDKRHYETKRWSSEETYPEKYRAMRAQCDWFAWFITRSFTAQQHAIKIFPNRQREAAPHCSYFS